MVKTKAYFKANNIYDYVDCYEVINKKEVYYFNKESKIYMKAKEFEIKNIGYIVSFRLPIGGYFSLDHNIEIGTILDKNEYIELILNNIDTTDLIKLNKSYELFWYLLNNISYMGLKKTENSENMLKIIFNEEHFIRDSST